MMNFKKSKSDRPGSAAVEFALVAPLFVLLVLGMIESGRMIMVQQLLTNAAREGARRGIIEGETEQDVKDVVTDYLNRMTIVVADDDITVTPAPETALPGEAIEVAITIEFSRVSWLPPNIFNSTVLESVSVMRREGIEPD